MFLRSVVALAFLGVFLLAQPSNAETSDDFNTVDLFFYGDLDNGDGNISTTRPTSDKDTQSDCPQESNERSWFGDDRQWGDVGSWFVDLGTPGEIESGTYIFRIWANATQGDVDGVQFRISVYVGGGGPVVEALSNEDGVDSEDEQATEFDIEFDISNETFGQGDQFRIDLEYSGGEDGSEPIIGGDSVKGPTAKIMRELGHPVSAIAVANYYGDFIDGFIVDTQDEAEASEIWKLNISVKVAETLITDLATKTKLANKVLDFSKNCSKRSLNLQKNGLSCGA